MSKNTHDYFYDLPERLIAQEPASPRDASKLFVYSKDEKKIEHRRFCDIVDYLKNGDVLVINSTRVLPVRLLGNKEGTGAKIEILLLKRIDLTLWQALVKPGKNARPGARFVIGDRLIAAIEAVSEEGTRLIRFEYEGVFEDILNETGEMPLPHYIKTRCGDKGRYNTVYSKVNGSAAAPTAGLHFTQELMGHIKEKGVIVAEVLLHVGLGTFRPVKTESVESHKMHSEYYELSAQTAEIINEAKRDGRRIVAVGTTSVRVLESAAALLSANTFESNAQSKNSLTACAPLLNNNENKNEQVKLSSVSGYTDIFIYPPYKFKIVDALITNFHLPESTLIMLVSAFCGREETLMLYDQAIKEEYRFFSFGDAMLIQ